MKTRSSFTKAPRGFALVITMSLMVLLLVLAVGLLSLSAVTLRTSSLTDPQRVAQANARLGLMLAIGELQKAAGKDQRITGTADLAGTATGERISDGAAPKNNSSVNNQTKGLSPVHAGTRQWTGVWENQILQTAGADPGKAIFNTTPSPRLVQWLVSGNENTTTPRYLPDSAALAVDGGGKVADAKQAVLLVGEHTVGAASNDTVQNYVAAPLVKIASENAPGGYAWWVGDEGVKSRLNTSSPYSSGAIATNATMSAQRRGWETVDGFGGYPLPGSDSSLKGILTNAQAALVNTSLTNGTPSSLNKVFHAATTDSFGVLSDTLHGGLRTDLTPILTGTLPTSPIPGVANSPLKGANIIPDFGAEKFSPKKGPTWDKIKAFADLRKNLSGDNLIVKEAASDSEPTIAPVMLELRLLLGARVMAGSAADKFRVHPSAKIAVVLANPYPYNLTWQTGLELELKSNRNDGYRTSCIYPVKGQPPYLSRGNTTEAAVLTDTVFKIAGGSLKPGEAQVYMMNSQVTKNLSTAGQKTNVTLTPLSPASLFNLNNSIFLLHTTDNSTADHPNTTDAADPTKTVNKKDERRLIMDIREDELTSQVNVELRLGPTKVLRRFERFELDNANFASNQKILYYEGNKAEHSPPDRLLAKNNLNKPFGLQIYSFQLSQPGIDYQSNFADPTLYGLRSTTMRTFADFNLQAANIRKSIVSYNPAPYFMWMSNSVSALPFPTMDNPIYDANPGGQDFTNNLTGTPFRWGYNPTDGSSKTILFSAPEKLTSLAQLQHADLTADDEFASIGHQPGNAVGNSYASPFVKRELTVQNRTNYTIKRNAEVDAIPANFFDISYRLNAALWDTYFFSTIENGKPLNQQMIKLDAGDSPSELSDPSTVAGHLLVEGAFNINSTQKDAWKALLGSSKYLKHPADAADSNDAFFPRSLEQKASSISPPTGKSDDSYAGYRRLTDAQIDAVAEEIVKQVRMRGPFLSLSHFVNRALVPLTTNKELGRSGALQAALDASGANISIDGKSAFADIDVQKNRMNLLKDPDGDVGAPDLARDRAKDASNMTSLPQGSPAVWPQYSKDKNPGSVASIIADLPMLKDSAYRQEQGFRSTGIPGWLTQADVLQVIGPAISARSDTFRIRAYGEATDSKGKVIAKAWCEAIVQRTSSYVDSSNADSKRGNDLTTTNQTLGRKMNLVSFRWLSPNEI